MNLQASLKSWDAVIVGAGPAGALAANLIAQRGRQVLLLDKASFPRNKVCGGCLSGRAVRLLHDLGLANVISQGHSLKSFRLAHRGRIANLPTRGVAISRRLLDQNLVESASDQGALFQDRTRAWVGPVVGDSRVVKIRREGIDQFISAKIVLICSGLGSVSSILRPDFFPENQVGRSEHGSVSMDERIDKSTRIGVNCQVPSNHEFEPGQINMSVSKNGYVGVTMLEDGQLNVSAALGKTAAKGGKELAKVVEGVLEESGLPIPESMENSQWLGTPALTRHLETTADERLFVVGDAAGYVEPFTGEGMGWALDAARRVAPLAEQAMVRWDNRLIQKWNRESRRYSQRRKRVCRWIRTVSQSAKMVSFSIWMLANFPLLAGPALRAIHGKPLEVSGLRES